MQDYLVTTAMDGIDAIRQLVDPLPDVIISDLNMPVMSGYEFMSVVRRRFPQIPVIAVSGEYRKGEMPAHVPADAYFPKGAYLVEELCTAIKELVCGFPLRPKRDQSDDSNPVPIDGFGKLLLQCTHCLRPIKMDAGGLNGGFHSAQCNSCQTFIRFQIDHQSGNLTLQATPSSSNQHPSANMSMSRDVSIHE
jgi:CheY-like chemotaxis protein